MAKHKSRTILIMLVVFIVLVVAAIAIPNSPVRIEASRLSSQADSGGQTGPPIHAVHIEFGDYDLKGAQGAALNNYLAQTPLNLISLTAGRVEWTFFKWQDRPEYWATDVSASGTDFLATDSAQFKKYGKIDAEIDVLSPNYILTHPAAAAVDAGGKASTDLVSLTELTQGTYGKLLTLMVTYIASNYPDVNSISITEMTYRTDGYGPDDKASYLQLSQKKDWPRNSDGSIAIDDPSIINWRSQILGNFLGKLAAIAHAHGKQLFLDISSTVNNQNQFTNQSGVQLDVMLQKVDKLVVWCYYSLDGNSPDVMKITAQALQKYGPGRIILSIGLWGPNNTVMDASLLQQGIQSAQEGGISNMWVTPSTLMDGSHWQVLANLWK